jgi:hypothetical protein
MTTKPTFMHADELVARLTLQQCEAKLQWIAGLVADFSAEKPAEILKRVNDVRAQLDRIESELNEEAL